MNERGIHMFERLSNEEMMVLGTIAALLGMPLSLWLLSPDELRGFVERVASMVRDCIL